MVINWLLLTADEFLTNASLGLQPIPGQDSGTYSNGELTFSTFMKAMSQPVVGLN
jgi:hypothetical protein